MLESYKATIKPQANANALENRRMMKAAMTSGEKGDLSQYALNGAPVQVKLDNERSRDIDDAIEAKTTPTQVAQPQKPQASTGVNPFAKKVAAPGDPNKKAATGDIFKDLGGTTAINDA